MKKLALAVLLAVVACAPLAWGQSGTIGQTDNSGTVMKQGTSKGAGTVVEGVPGVSDMDRNWITVATHVINGTAPNCPFPGYNDSSEAIPTTGWKELALRIYIRPKPDSVLAAQIGIQVSGAPLSSTDSMTMARLVEFQDPTPATATSAAVASVGDSLVDRIFPIANVVSDSAYRSTALSGEIVLTAVHSAEGRYWYHVPLATRQGVPFTADYTYIKVRLLRLFSSLANNVWNRYPLTGAPPTQCFRVDVVGRR
jgi:hypothetical protein